MREKIACRFDSEHTGKLFNVQIVALEVGKGTRKKGHSRARLTWTIGHACADCIKKAYFKIDGTREMNFEDYDEVPVIRQRLRSSGGAGGDIAK